MYEIAKQLPPGSHEWYGLDLAPTTTGAIFYAWQGVGYHTHAAPVSPKDLMASWRSHVTLSGADWLVPLLSQFAAGAPVDVPAVLAAYAAHHGCPAPSNRDGA